MKRKIPVLATSLAAFRFVFDHAFYAIRITMFWAIILRILLGLMIAFGLTSTLLVAYVVLVPLAWCAIAVLWHRRMLHDEEVAGLPTGLSFRTFRYLFSALDIGYEVLIAFVMGFFLSIAVFGSILFSPLPLPDSPLLIILIFISPWAAVVLVVLTRLSLVLPATALDDLDFDSREAWAATSGNNLRLLGLASLTLFPFLITTLLIGYFVGGPAWSDHESTLILVLISIGVPISSDPFSLGQFILSTLRLAIVFASAIVWSTVISFVYAFLIDNQSKHHAVPEKPALRHDSLGKLPRPGASSSRSS